MTDIERKIREEFPLIKNTTLAYLDNSATVQKPQCVMDAVTGFYEKDNANPMRGLYELSLRATDVYESAREAVARFISHSGSSGEIKEATEKNPITGEKVSPEEIIFTRNASESLNLVAYSYGMNFIKEGDEIIVSVAEHHSNFLPWQQVAKVTGARVVWFDCEADGSFSIDTLKALITDRTKLLAITQVSNVLGRVNDVKTMAELIHEKGGVIVVDGSQSVPHMDVNVKELDADFFAFSGHKMYAPMGIGVLYGKKALLEKMPPFLYGGEMIESVTKEKTVFAEVPHKFEAGTVNAGGAAGLEAAIRFIEGYGFDFIKEREDMLTARAFEKMKNMPHINIIGGEKEEDHHGIIAFQVEGVHPHDVSQIFADSDIAVRAGHHCAQPLHKHLGIMSSTRMSIAFYNTEEEIDRFIKVLSSIRSRMGYK
ncbi:MAG: SufS family cysteine desulfurase [Lachnospiraceae bacterium]|nr:SufS family cysteine desulfurase [Lachnospiraceae bacterium]